jgi:peptide subunit release factor 1 (eRF1)
MGAVFDAEDVAKNNRKIFTNAVKDLRPETKARIVKILNSWNGRASEKELEEILGNQRANKLRELVDISTTGELTLNEVDNLRRLFKESVTFD